MWLKLAIRVQEDPPWQEIAALQGSLTNPKYWQQALQARADLKIPAINLTGYLSQELFTQCNQIDKIIANVEEGSLGIWWQIWWQIRHQIWWFPKKITQFIEIIINNLSESL